MGTGLSFVIFLIILGLLVAAMRRGSSAVREKPNRLMSFATLMPLPDVIKAVIRYAQSNGYEISDIPREDRLIVGEAPSLTTWGFFYPIYLSERPDASTFVEVGIKSKVLQVGPVVARSHENFVNGVKAAILADGGTVDEHDASEPPFDRKRRKTARKTVEQPQRYCGTCGAEVRQGNGFCASCGERLNEVDTQPVVHGSDSRNKCLMDQGTRKITLYGAGVLLLLVVAYLLLSYSAPLTLVLIGLSVLAVLVVRKTRGNQTRLEQQVFERAGRYGGSARKAYEEGKHRELAQNAYRQSKEAYEETSTRYRDWSESRAAGHKHSPTPNTGVPFQSTLRSALQNLLRRFKDLPVALRVATVVLGALLLLTVLSPLGLVVALFLFGVSIIALIIHAAQRRSVKGWGAVAVASLILAFAFAGVSDTLYGDGLLGSANSGKGDAATPSSAPGNSNVASKDNAAGRGDVSEAAKEGFAKGPNADPQFQKITDDLRSLDSKSSLFLPSYLPFPAAKAGPGPGGYYIWSDARDQTANHIRIILIGPAYISSSGIKEKITLDGRSYPFSENFPSTMRGMNRNQGQYAVLLWARSEQGKEYMYQIEMNTLVNPLPPEEWRKVIRSLKRIDP